MQTTLPSVAVTSDDIQAALDFVHSFLRYDPSARITADVGMQHRFLGRGEFVSSEVDTQRQRTSESSLLSVFNPISNDRKQRTYAKNAGPI
ncbi:hypothetical protein AVEN_22599-1 [Araneus ventricosus]|uniref:Protein kinase domain-containing protein n=1 Tax=Araneus ventricosus TaxID=182803 RepID=A0A4Y2E7G4_ARAVE|nr:hypothetical protein AVEN_22599-1 [Araneus ventricosus]